MGFLSDIKDKIDNIKTEFKNRLDIIQENSDIIRKEIPEKYIEKLKHEFDSIEYNTTVMFDENLEKKDKKNIKYIEKLIKDVEDLIDEADLSEIAEDFNEVCELVNALNNHYATPANYRIFECNDINTESEIDEFLEKLKNQGKIKIYL